VSARNNLYVGRAGQMVVMAEFLWRGWNVAIPEVDVGEDIFVVEDQTGELSRVQVKTATAQSRGEGYTAQFTLSFQQLRTTRVPDLIYVFAIREGSRWEPFIIMDRDTLNTEQQVYRIGSVSGESVTFRLVWDNSKLRCGHRDFGQYRDGWSRWRIIKH
jgi:hypothetical protein